MKKMEFTRKQAWELDVYKRQVLSAGIETAETRKII